jgi:predicted  nucleic acid-binding Zn-ribbon protein
MFDLHKIVTSLRKQLQDLRKQRDHTEMQMVNVNVALRSLAREIEDKKEREALLAEIKASRRKPAGLTEAISESLRAMLHSSLSANEVREWLEKEGFDLSDYSQPLATISVTLRRLEKSGRVKATREGRRVTYKWVGD